jgi:hypothetical protein
MMTAWFYVLVVMSDSPYLKPGQEIVSNEAYYSEESCAKAARLVAQGLFVKEGTKYGYRCKPVDYEPPNLDKPKENK